jgi:two-component SAPR family response regulator
MLNGRTALIVEEEFLIALDIQRMLENEGAGQTLFARSATEAEQLRAYWPDLAVAIVEVRHQDTAMRQLIESLRIAAIPVILITSEVGLHHDSGLGQTDLAVVIKPVPEDAMAKAIRQALAAEV